jgi:hypothetical protein
MKTVVISLLALMIALSAAAEEPAAAAIEDLAWLAGHWRAELGSATIEEGWFPPAGGAMLGINRTVAGDRMAGFEFLRIEEDEGGIVYFASPGGRSPATPFTLVELDGQRAVFENAEHDFPQRIAYRREGSMLHAEIEGVEGGEHKKGGWVFELMP